MRPKTVRSKPVAAGRDVRSERGQQRDGDQKQLTSILARRANIQRLALTRKRCRYGSVAPLTDIEGCRCRIAGHEQAHGLGRHNRPGQHRCKQKKDETDATHGSQISPVWRKSHDLDGAGLDPVESYWFFSRFGGDLLSHVLRRSTIGATALNDRVRDGIGCFARAMTTKPRKKPSALHLGFSWLEAAFRRSRQRVPTPRVIQVQRLPPDIQVGLHIGVQAKFVYALICV